MALLIADPNSDWSKANDTVCSLADLLSTDDLKKANKKLTDTLAEVFDGSNFRNSSPAFEGVTLSDVKVKVKDGAVTITVKSKDSDYDNYQSPSGSAALVS